MTENTVGDPPFVSENEPLRSRRAGARTQQVAIEDQSSRLELLRREVIASIDKQQAVGDRPDLFSVLDEQAKNRIATRSAALLLDAPTQSTPLRPNEECLAVEITSFVYMFASMITQASRQARSKGYEPAFVEGGINPIVARGLANLFRKHGERQAQEGKLSKPVVAAIRFLAEPHRQPARVMKRCRFLLEVYRESSVIESLFDSVGLSDSEFISLITARVDGHDVNLERLSEIAVDLTSRLSPKRGPKITAASAAHSFALANALKLRSPRRRHNQDGPVEKYVDALTEATRREFNQPNFDARPAKRRAKRAQTR